MPGKVRTEIDNFLKEIKACSKALDKDNLSAAKTHWANATHHYIKFNQNVENMSGRSKMIGKTKKIDEIRKKYKDYQVEVGNWLDSM